MNDLTTTSPKSRAIAMALSVALGFCGAHRFYVGKSATGVLQLLTIGGVGLWWVYDIILVSAGGFRDGQNRRVLNWQESDSPAIDFELKGERARILVDEIEAQRLEVAELSERVEFLERMLPRVGERDGLPRGID